MIVTLTVREVAATIPCFGSWNFTLISQPPGASGTEIAKFPWVVASRSVATFLNAPVLPPARANTVTVPFTCPVPGATVPMTSALPPCDSTRRFEVAPCTFTLTGDVAAGDRMSPYGGVSVASSIFEI